MRIIRNKSGSIGTEGRSRVGLRLSLLVLAGLALLLRLLALPPALPELDAANFARALTRFDLASQSPHAPGYPLYVLAARLFAALGAPDLLALVLPGALLGALSVPALGLALAGKVGRTGALLAATLVALAPLPVLTGGAPTSDGAGFALLTLAAAALLSLRPGRALAPLAAGLLLGLVLGVRPSYAPIVLPMVALAPLGTRLRAFVALGATGLALLTGLALVVGPAELLRLLPAFAAGHATEWGGTILVAPSLAQRAQQLAAGLFTTGLGLPGVDVLGPGRLVLAVLLGAVPTFALLARPWTSPRRARLLRQAAMIALLYGLFAFSLQNVAKARHALPLLLPLALGLAALLPVRPLRAGLAAFVAAPADLAGGTLSALAANARRLLLRSPAAMLPAVAACVLLATTLPLARAQGTRPSPAAAFVAYVRAELPAEGAQYFTGDEGRLLTAAAPWYRAGRPVAAELSAHAARLQAQGVQLFVTSAAPGVEALRGHLEPIATFTDDPLLPGHVHTLTLFRLQSDALADAGLPR